MDKIFNLDNKFFSAINKWIDMCILSILWIIFSLPIITIGASTIALYHATFKVIREERGELVKEFWRGFYQNLKQSILLTIFVLMIGTVYHIDIMLIKQLNTKNNIMLVLILLLTISLGFVACSIFYMIPYIARFSTSMKMIMINSFLIGIRHILTTLLLVLWTCFITMICFYIPILILIIPCIYMFFLSVMVEKIFDKYQ